MRNLIAISLGLFVVAVAACGSSSTNEASCGDVGGLCLKSGSICGDTLPYTCPSNGVCCSPTSGNSIAPANEPTAR